MATAFVVGAMWAPDVFFQLAMILMILIGSAVVTVIAVGSGYFRIFCMGFASAVGVYLLALILVESHYSIFQPAKVHLPTTTLWAQLQPFVTQVRSGDYYGADLHTKLIWQDDNTFKDEAGNHFGAIKSLDLVKSPRIGQQYIDFAPSLNVFYAIGHSLWMLALGYTAGKFAVAISRSRDHQEDDASR